MSRLFYHVMQDNVGNLLFDVSGTMRLAGTGTAATIYGDAALTVPISNPMTNHASFGSFKCYLGPGTYDFYMAKAGYTFETLTGLQGGGSLANQDASAVALGNCQAERFHVPERTGNNTVAFQTDLVATGGTGRFGFYASGSVQHYLNGPLGLGGFAEPGGKLTVKYAKSSYNGLWVQPSDNDTGGSYALVTVNLSGVGVGGIFTTATTTAYNTTSDSRLKKAIIPLTGALAVVRALSPVRFKWRSDDSPGVGLLAGEVQKVVPEAVTGASDALHPDGTVNPQQLDYSKLVPWLTAALKEALERIDVLTARVAHLEGG